MNVSSRGLPLIETSYIDCGYFELVVKYSTFDAEPDVGYAGGIEIVSAKVNDVEIPLTQNQVERIEDYLRE